MVWGLTARYRLPSTFSIRFENMGSGSYRLTTSQVLPVSPEKAFIFFEDPRNLFEITPDWLDFRMVDAGSMTAVHEGAMFDYTIRWFGVPFRWRGRIADYHPPDRFTDIQDIGPYRSWVHLHSFKTLPGGTLMEDTVDYRVPFGLVGCLAHRLLVRRQLQDIFCYRAVRIREWVTGNFRPKGRCGG